jgi:hypothetical protein
MLTLSMLDVAELIKGGPGSGYHGHAGRPGKVGGSAPVGAPVVGDYKEEAEDSYGDDEFGFDEESGPSADNLLNRIFEKDRKILGDEQEITALRVAWATGGFSLADAELGRNRSLYDGIMRNATLDELRLANDLNPDHVLDWMVYQKDAGVKIGDDAWQLLDGLVEEHGDNKILARTPMDTPRWFVEKNLHPDTMAHVAGWLGHHDATLTAEAFNRAVPDLPNLLMALNSLEKENVPYSKLMPAGEWAKVPPMTWDLYTRRMDSSSFEGEIMAALVDADEHATLSGVLESMAEHAHPLSALPPGTRTHWLNRRFKGQDPGIDLNPPVLQKMQDRGFPTPDPLTVEKARRNALEMLEFNARHSPHAEDYAGGVDTENVLRKAKAFVNGATEEYPLTIRVHAANVESLLQDGRFKTQLETGMSGGSFNESARIHSEWLGLGIDKEADPLEHPIYGYFAHPNTLDMSNYGEVDFVLKDEVKHRATVTMGDSLSDFMSGTLIGSPSGDIDLASMGSNLLAASEGDIPDYIEAQIHGGVSMQDVAKVVYHRYPFGFVADEAGVLQRLRDAGFDVEVIDR